MNKNASVVKNGTIPNNNFVVPHNIKLLKKYEAHINVEWCNRTSAVKYLFKYITKGVDRATAVIEKGIRQLPLTQWPLANQKREL